MKLSILTATYNREVYLCRLYESILENENSNLEIEWIIIDDGSTDSTSFTVTEFILDKRIEIKYSYQSNSGKMNAINNGINLATGDFIIECDSDDFFARNAFKIIEENLNYLTDNKDIYGLCFLKQKGNGEISGNKFKKSYMKSTMFDLYFKEDIQGEKILVFNSNIRKQFKHELEKGEKFITEARMYHKMDERYKIICINEIIEIGDYIEDGYTVNIDKIFKQSPNGYYKYFKEILQRKDKKGMLWKKRLYVFKHLLLFSFLKRKRKGAL